MSLCWITSRVSTATIMNCKALHRLRKKKAKFKATMNFRVVAPLICCGVAAQGEASAR